MKLVEMLDAAGETALINPEKIAAIITAKCREDDSPPSLKNYYRVLVLLDDHDFHSSAIFSTERRALNWAAKRFGVSIRRA